MEGLFGMLAQPKVQTVVSDFLQIEQSGKAFIGDGKGPGCENIKKQPVMVRMHSV